MSSASSALGSEKARIFEMILSSPGMNEKCRLSLTISRQNFLLLSRLIEAAFLSKKKAFEDDLLAVLPDESVAEMKLIHEEILGKTGLTDFYQRLKLL